MAALVVSSSLDEYAWGYCRYCGRMVIVEEDGTLTKHRNFQGVSVERCKCLGSATEPTQPPGPDVDPRDLVAGFVSEIEEDMVRIDAVIRVPDDPFDLESHPAIDLEEYD